MNNSSRQTLECLVVNVTEKTAGHKDATKPYVGLEHIPSGGGSLVGYGSAADSISTNNVFRAGDTLFGKLRPQLRKSLRVAFDGYCSTDILVLRPLAGVCGEFAAKVAQSDAVFGQAIRTEEGTKMPRTSWEAIRSVQIFAPKDEAEQRKIAWILTTLDNLIEKTEALIAKYQAIKQGMMHDLLTRGVDAHGRLRPSQAEAPNLYKQSELGWIPKEWGFSTLEGATERVIVGLALSVTGSYREKGVPLIRNQNIRRGFFEDDDMLYLDPDFAALFPSKSLFAGDVLTVRTGANVGDTALLPEKYVGCLTFTTLITTPKTSILYSPYLVSYLDSAHGLSELNRLLVGGGKENMNVGEFLKLRLPLPSVNEQKACVATLSSLTAKIEAERIALRKLRATKTGLMQDLLTGKVRVKADKAEEVAHA